MTSASDPPHIEHLGGTSIKYIPPSASQSHTSETSQSILMQIGLLEPYDPGVLDPEFFYPKTLEFWAPKN